MFILIFNPHLVIAKKVFVFSNSPKSSQRQSFPDIHIPPKFQNETFTTKQLIYKALIST